MTLLLQEFSYVWMPHYGSGEDPPTLHKLHFQLTLTLRMEAACFLKDQQNSPVLHGPRPKNRINGNSLCYHNNAKRNNSSLSRTGLLQSMIRISLFPSR